MENITYVVCKICGKHLKELNAHLSKSHKITLKEYLNTYPDAKIICEESSKKKSEKCSAARKELIANGYTTSDETKEKMSNKHKERWVDLRNNDEFMEKFRDNAAKAREAKGDDYHHTEETLLKMRGPREYMRGMKRSEETRRKISEKAKARQDRGPHSEETIQKIKDSWTRRKQDTETYGEYLKGLSERSKQQSIDRGGYPSIDTSVPNGFEKLYIRFCNDNNIKYEWNYLIENRRYDFYLPETNTLVELDGEYWHKQPHAIENDQLKNEIAIRNGYRLIRISSDDASSPRAMLRRFRETFDWSIDTCIKHNNNIINGRIQTQYSKEDDTTLPVALFDF